MKRALSIFLTVCVFVTNFVNSILAADRGTPSRGDMRPERTRPRIDRDDRKLTRETFRDTQADVLSAKRELKKRKAKGSKVIPKLEVLDRGTGETEVGEVIPKLEALDVGYGKVEDGEVIPKLETMSGEVIPKLEALDAGYGKVEGGEVISKLENLD